MLLTLSDVSSEPLHRQVFRQIRAQILSGDLRPDDPIPSIRGLARDQHVSVITVQRAYEDLEREELIQSRRGKGFFVAPLNQRARHRMAEERATDALTLAISEAMAEGLDADDVRRLIDSILAEGIQNHDQ